MKIIEQGKKYPWQGRYRCKDCGTVLELEEGDSDLVLLWINHDRLDPDGLYGVEVLIQCPTCNERRALWL